MSSQSFYARLRGKFRRTLCVHCARRPVPIKLSHPVVSFTFDDFPASACDTGAPILEKYGVRGTYYASMGLAGKVGPAGRYFSEPDLRALFTRGHELGCHTFDHRHAWRTPAKEYERSIILNRERLKQILPEADFTSHSYPIGDPRPRTKKICARYFSCARGGGQRANKRLVDANYLSAFFIEKTGGNLSAVKAQIDHAKSTSSWLIFATHDLYSSPSSFGCSPELFEEIVSYTVEIGIAVLPVFRAFKMLQVDIIS